MSLAEVLTAQCGPKWATVPVLVSLWTSFGLHEWVRRATDDREVGGASTRAVDVVALVIYGAHLSLTSALFATPARGWSLIGPRDPMILLALSALALVVYGVACLLE